MRLSSLPIFMIVMLFSVTYIFMWFVNPVPDPDSFYFLSFTKENHEAHDFFSSGSMLKDIAHNGEIALMLTMLISCIVIIIVMYSIMMRFGIWRRYAFLTMILFCCDALFWFAVRPRIYDKHIIVMAIFVSIIYVIITRMNPIVKAVSLFILFELGVWSSEMMMIYIFVIGVSVIGIGYNEYMKIEKISAIFLSSILVGLMTYLFYGHIGFLIDQKHLIGETRYIWQLFTPAYLFYIVIIILGVMTYRAKSNGIFFKVLPHQAFRLIFLLAGIFVVMTILIFRFYSITIMLLYLVLAFVMQYRRFTPKEVFLIVALFILYMGISYPMYQSKELLDYDKIQQDLAIYGKEDCIISDWGPGHILQYYTDADVLCKGHPTDDCLRWYSQGMIDICACKSCISYRIEDENA